MKLINLMKHLIEIMLYEIKLNKKKVSSILTHISVFNRCKRSFNINVFIFRFNIV
jgi:hypothetical protein